MQGGLGVAPSGWKMPGLSSTQGLEIPFCKATLAEAPFLAESGLYTRLRETGWQTLGNPLDIRTSVQVSHRCYLFFTPNLSPGFRQSLCLCMPAVCHTVRFRRPGNYVGTVSQKPEGMEGGRLSALPDLCAMTGYVTSVNRLHWAQRMLVYSPTTAQNLSLGRASSPEATSEYSQHFRIMWLLSKLYPLPTQFHKDH